MRDEYILDSDGNPILESDPKKWIKWFREESNWRVAFTEINGVKISTIFLGIDHNLSGNGPPLLWETCIFGGKFNNEVKRYSSLKYAIDGHSILAGKITRENLPKIKI